MGIPAYFINLVKKYNFIFYFLFFIFLFFIFNLIYNLIELKIINNK